jgi:hypothetical protein
VYHDLLGMMQHPHHAKVTPKFCKQFGAVGEVSLRLFSGSHSHFKRTSSCKHLAAECRICSMPWRLKTLRKHTYQTTRTATSAAIVQMVWVRPQAVQQALGQYREEVEGGSFPSAAFSPYQIADEHRAAAAEAARAEGFLAAAAALDPAGDREAASAAQPV